MHDRLAFKAVQEQWKDILQNHNTSFQRFNAATASQKKSGVWSACKISSSNTFMVIVHNGWINSKYVPRRKQNIRRHFKCPESWWAANLTIWGCLFTNKMSKVMTRELLIRMLCKSILQIRKFMIGTREWYISEKKAQSCRK